MATLDHFGRRVEDHVLLLQLERAQEVLSDRVDEHQHDDECDCDCADTALSRLDDGLDDLRDSLAAAVNIIAELTERVVSLEENQAKLLEALERALLQ